MERSTLTVKCLAQEHNAMSPAKAQTWTAQSTADTINQQEISQLIFSNSHYYFWGGERILPDMCSSSFDYLVAYHQISMVICKIQPNANCRQHSCKWNCSNGPAFLLTHPYPCSLFTRHWLWCSISLKVVLNITLTNRNLQGMSLLKTPDSRASTWPPTYVSESRTWPSLVSLLNTYKSIFNKRK